MVLYLLYLKAELENVGSVTLERDQDLQLHLKNPLSDDEVRENIVVNPSVEVEQEASSRLPSHHFSLTWQGSKKASVLTVLDEAGAKAALKKKKGASVPRSYAADDSGDWVPLLAVECRGLEPFAYLPGSEFVVTSSEGFQFTEDVDFSEGDWADYDAEHDLPVSLSDIQFKWEAV